MRSIVRTLTRRTVLQRGVRGGSPFWLVVGALGLVKRGYDRLGRRQESVVLAERIRSGDELLLRYVGPPSRQTRRETRVIAARTAKAAAEQRRALLALTRKAERGGLGARRARRALARRAGE